MGRVSVSGFHRFKPDYPEDERRRHEFVVRRMDTYLFTTWLGLGGVGMWLLFFWLHDPATPRWTWIPWTAISLGLLTTAASIWRRWRQYRIDCIARDLGG